MGEKEKIKRGIPEQKTIWDVYVIFLPAIPSFIEAQRPISSQIGFTATENRISTESTQVSGKWTILTS